VNGDTTAPDEHMMRLYASGTLDRFTDRARRAVALADQAAGSMGHDTVDTGHLLLGLIGEGEAGAAQALKAAGVTIGAATEAVCRDRPPGDAAPSCNRAFAPSLQRALELASREALQLGHNFVGTEHLLLGLVQEGTAGGVLALADCAPDAGDPFFPGAVCKKVHELLRGYGEAEAEKRRALRAAVAPRAAERQAFAWELIGRWRKFLGHIEDMGDDERLFLLGAMAGSLEGMLRDAGVPEPQPERIAR